MVEGIISRNGVPLDSRSTFRMRPMSMRRLGRPPFLRFSWVAL